MGMVGYGIMAWSDKVPVEMTIGHGCLAGSQVMPDRSHESEIGPDDIAN